MSRVRSVEGVDLAILADWMDGEGLPPGPLEEIELLSGGTQNILLRFSRGGRSYVLRRPPPHKRRNSDETMRREARVLRALAGSPVPHPGFIAGCGDEAVLGAAFYLMEPVRGFNPTTGLPPLHEGDAGIRHEMGLSMARAIAELGEFDYRAIGLEGFGKPEGYLERQVPRWQAQLDGYSALEGYPGPDIPGLAEVARWLDEHRPTDFRAGVIHGDFHAANVMFSLDGPELAALVDWELSTVGDPLLDLGWLLATCPDETGHGVGPSAWPGFPRPEELLARYGERSTRDLASIAWYEVLACYKLGIILEGTHARAFAGKAAKETGDLLHATTVGLFQRALRRIAA
ncbi:MAG: phosphotransferase family protein [Deltaproteobacteria bacterium]|jgi:aminoglycoside phosphotransferase (APT) family kinase protein|nr:phosphotransferase family protein [Deltaproteobacteria bacterium]